MVFRFCLLFFCLLADEVPAQQWAWVNQVGNTSGNSTIQRLSPYKEGQFLMAGGFGVNSLNMGSATHANAGQEDGFVAICNMDGSYAWSSRMGGTGEDAATAVVADKEGRIYVAGSFKSLSMNVGGTTLTNQGDKDIFVIKYRIDKSVEWAIRLGTAFTDEVVGMAVDDFGNIYLGGHYINSSISTSDKAFVMALHPTGTILWQKFASVASGSASATSFVVDDANRCYLAGTYSGRLAFDGGQSITSTTGYTGFMVQYSSTGAFSKAISLPGMGKVNSMSIKGEQLMVCGEKVNYAMGWGWPLSDSKIYVARYNTNLDLVWEKAAGGTVPFQSLDIARTISTDDEGNSYVTGYFFSPKLGFAGDSLPNIFNKDYYYPQLFLLKYDASGKEIWGRSLGGSLTDQGTSVLAFGNDKVLLAGSYESDSIGIGTQMLFNNATLNQIYVHLKPWRYGRNAISFLTLFEGAPTSVMDKQAPRLLLHPNPACDMVRWEMEGSDFIPERICLFSMDGRRIETRENIVGTEGNVIDVSNLQPGNYFILMENRHQQAVARFVKR